MCMFMYHVHAMPCKDQKRASEPYHWREQMLQTSVWVWESDPGSLEEHGVASPLAAFQYPLSLCFLAIV